jgi:acetyltransferase
MNLNNFLNPKSIAIIGASADRKKVGYQILSNIINNGYKGELYPVNLKEKDILGLSVCAGVEMIKKEIDLVIISIPAEFVLAEIKKCARAKIKNIIIISSNFAEAGKEGKIREEEIKKAGQELNLNILGPNCFGIVNSSIGLNATFSKAKIKKGKIAFISQSGAIASAVLDWAADRNLGFSKFISLGNKILLNENDFFETLKSDKETELIIIYLEEIEEGEKFMENVSRLTKIKPVAILKGGKSEEGAKAAMSHTGSLAGSSEAVSAGLKRSGAIFLESLTEMQALMILSEKIRKIKSSEIFIISNAGGPAVLATDSIIKNGLKLGNFSVAAASNLKNKMPSFINAQNPLDIIGDADSERYRIALESLLPDKNIINLFVLLTPQSSTEVEKTAKYIVSAAKKYSSKFLAANFIGGKAVEDGKNILNKNQIINFSHFDEILKILKKIIEYNKLALSLKPYRPVKNKIAKRKNLQLDYLNSLKILAKYKIPAIPAIKINSFQDLAKLKYPIVLKAVGSIIHKTEKKAVVLNLNNYNEASKAFKSLSGLLKSKNNYCLAQPMISGAVELILGFKRDENFGPIIMVGAGGIYAETIKDIELEVGDINKKRAAEIVKKLKIYPILNGSRGRKKLAISALIKAIVNLARLAQKNPEIFELDINPLFINENGVVAADVRIIK